MLRPLLSGLVDLAFPPGCVSCGAPTEPTRAEGLRHVCAACAPQIFRVKAPHCTCCGHPFFGEVAADTERLCPHCTGLHPAFDEGRTLTLFRGPARDLIHALKYHRAIHVVEDLETLARAHTHGLALLRDATLVPVPLHPRKARARGFDQVALLAAALARAAGLGTRVEPLLRRVTDTLSQTSLDRAARRANLKNAFALAPGATVTPDLHYVLIDDVFTTGSTLNACATVLRRAGARRLDVLTFGHG
jgi:ComF family protein